ncbi:MFS transporter [Tomitella gaofuii]|uniref:MFS transporter n=1 Tax=Tomitella gaofuii TaxID=2760083 RepID=UPI0015FB4861|nr:MFS transporter [Tomitella gaofuii]
MSTTMVERGATRAGVRDWLGLAVLCGAVLIIAIDATVLDLAVPSISEHLEPTTAQLLWIIDIYSFVLAALLVTMGVLADRVGRRRLLMLGVAGFGAASVLAAFSVSPGMLIAARVLQGLFGAMLMPSTLGIIRATFLDGRQRATAIGVWGAMWGGGAAGGPLVGGWLLEHFWWGSVFLVAVPVLLVMLVAMPFVLRESRDPRPGRFDVPGVLLSVGALAPLIYALKDAASHGLSARTGALVVAGVLCGWAFVARQRRAADPMIDVRLFRNPVFSTAILTNLLSVFGLAGVLFFGTQYLQMVLGYSPLEAGLLAAPGTAASMVSALLAAAVARRIGVRLALAGSILFAAAGAVLLMALGVDGRALVFVVGFVVVGLGTGLGLTLTSAVVVDVVEPERAGAASGISETSYELGVAAGVAVLGSVVMGIYRAGVDVAGLAAGQATVVRDTLGGAVRVAGEIGGAQGDVLLDSARHAFVNGMHVAAGSTAALLACAGAAILVLLRPRPTGQDAAPADGNSAS